MSAWRHHRTGRLRLDQATVDDVGPLHEIHADPASWIHLPQGRHSDEATTRAMVERQVAGWYESGLGYWTVRERDSGQVVGWAGCSWRSVWPGWNLAYRFATSTRGRGYATEVGRVALEAAADVTPTAPVVAYLLEHNVASLRTAERLGLQQAWRGPDVGNDDPAAVRLVHADRELSDDVLSRVVAH